MIFKEFGNRKSPVIILIHGGGLSWWSWQKEIEILQNNYYVITPIIDGHGEDYATTFLSIEDSAEKVINYINTNHQGTVFALCGLSIGGQIVLEMLSKKDNIAENTIIESALVYPMKVTTSLIIPMYKLFYGLIKKRWFAKLQAKTLNIPVNLFETYFQDASSITKESLINITKSNGLYSLSPDIYSINSKILILAGEKELSIMKKSAFLLNSSIKNSKLKILKNYSHGELSLLHHEEYIKLLEEFFQYP